MSDERIFTEKELSLMQKLGLSPEKVKALADAADKKAQRDAKRKQNCFLTEYYLMHIAYCKLCQSSKVVYFKMQKELTVVGGILHSIPVSEEEFLAGEIKKELRDQHLTCDCCSKVLLSLEKEALVKLCIDLQRRVVR